MMIKPLATIFGIRGYELSKEELDFIREYNPLGFILFSRNIKDPDQVANLVKQLKKSVGRSIVPILIDQEGGRVARLKSPHWRHPPAVDVFGKIAAIDQERAIKLCRDNAKLLAFDLHKLGINTVCAPVLDILFPEAHGVIGNRAFSDDKHVVTKLGEAMIEGFVSMGVAPIIKHIPGHGRARVDSHLELPVVNASYKDLSEVDFYPFKELSHKAMWAMTAHILYTAIDPNQVATFSSPVIEMIRNVIGFKSIIITDCLTMKALDGTLGDKALKSFAAGCDIVLHSNGDLEQMLEVAKVSPVLTDYQWEVIKESYAELKFPGSNFDFAKLASEVDKIICEYLEKKAEQPGFDPTTQLH